MKTREELYKIYLEEFLPKLTDIEKKRKRIRLLRVLTTVLIIAAVFTGNTYFFYVFLLALIPVVLKTISTRKEFTAEFKQVVVAKVIELVNPSYEYKSNGGISAEVFRASKVGDRYFNSYDADDYVKGRIGDIDFEFCDLDVWHKKKSSSSSGSNSNSMVFRGLFFYVDFNKYISSETLVRPDVGRMLLGGLGEKLQDSLTERNLVKLEDPEFEKYYVVYSQSQQEARYILTPTMMETMANVRKSLNYSFYFSFIGDKMYCGIYSPKKQFEPKVREIVSFYSFRKMYEQVNLVEDIVTQMNLNDRIWTKE